MAHDGEPLLPGFVDDGEVALPWSAPVDFDEVDPHPLERAHDPSRLAGVAGLQLVLVEALSIQDRPGPKDARAREQPRCYSRSPSVYFAEVASNVPHPRDPVRQEHGQRACGGPAQVDVHVPQPAYHELAPPVQPLRAPGYRRATPDAC